MSELKAFADDKYNVVQRPHFFFKLFFLSFMAENMVVKGENAI